MNYETKKIKSKAHLKDAENSDSTKALARYVILRFLEEISHEEFTKVDRNKFENEAELARVLRNNIDNFDTRFKKYEREFLDKYAG
jgi:hypothetical protein